MLAGTRYLAIHHLLGHRQRELNTPVEHTSKEQVEVVSVGLDIIQEQVERVGGSARTGKEVED